MADLGLSEASAQHTLPWLLDVCCGAGGAAEGYKRAGFYVVGIDVHPQPRYVGDRFIQADALRALDALRIHGWHTPDGDYLEAEDFAAIHASFPCQAWSDLQKQNKRNYPDLIFVGRRMLRDIGLPYVIENVEGAPLIDPIVLCGTMFPGLRVLRHRLFEASFPLVAPWHAPKHPLVFTHDKRKAHHGKLEQDTSFVQVTGGGNCTVANKRAAMGIDWMTGAEINEAIPPAYTEYVGAFLRAALTLRRVA